VFPEQWIRQSGPTAWPARVPNLNPLYFYLWGHMKSTVYATGLATTSTELIKMARMAPGISQRVIQLLFGRANSYVGAQNGHLGHCL
jgi:hypothetical protein